MAQLPLDLRSPWTELGTCGRDLEVAHGVPDCPHASLGRVPRPYPRVISASKRTDVPAFYLDWMIERCRIGWVDVPNPVFRNAADPLKRLTHVSLRPEHVIAIVWWSKNYHVYQKRHRELAQYRTQYFHFTINSRREDLQWLEPDVPPLEKALEQVRFLADLPGGPGMVAWRYDPICFWMEGGERRSSWDVGFFERMCRELSGIGVRTCFTSVADRYARFEERIRRFYPGVRLRDPDDEELAGIAAEMGATARAYGVALFACTEPRLIELGVCRKGACIDGSLLGATTRGATDRKMRGREECGCTLHTDIGDYVTQECRYSCIYCYANRHHRRFGSGSERAAGPTAPRVERKEGYRPELTRGLSGATPTSRTTTEPASLRLSLDEVIVAC